MSSSSTGLPRSDAVVSATLKELTRKFKKTATTDDVRTLRQLVQSDLRPMLRSGFYAAISALTYRVPGSVDLTWMQWLFEAIVQNLQHFSPGVGRKLSMWLTYIKALQQNPAVVLPGLDVGRFGYTPPPMSVRGTLNAHATIEQASNTNAQLVSTNVSVRPVEPSICGQFTPYSFPFRRWSADVVAPIQFRHEEGLGAKQCIFELEPTFFSNLTQSHSLRIQCRFVILNPDSTSYSLAMPQGVVATVNACVIDPSGPQSRDDGTDILFGYDVTPSLVSGKNTLAIRIHQCCCRFSFALRLTESFSDEALTAGVQKRCPPSSTSLSIARDHILRTLLVGAGGEELASSGAKVSLLDPNTLLRVATPVRGHTCTHVQCFDLASYIRTNRQKARFRCPICNQTVLLENLIIDWFFADVLEQTGPTVHDVFVASDGTWKIAEATPTSRNLKRSSSVRDVLASRDVVVVDDESADDSKDQATFKKLKQHSHVIDLT